MEIGTSGRRATGRLYDFEGFPAPLAGNRRGNLSLRFSGHWRDPSRFPERGGRLTSPRRRSPDWPSWNPVVSESLLDLPPIWLSHADWCLAVAIQILSAEVMRVPAQIGSQNEGTGVDGQRKKWGFWNANGGSFLERPRSGQPALRARSLVA